MRKTKVDQDAARLDPGFSAPINVQAAYPISQAGISLAEFNTLILSLQDEAYSFACYLTGDPDLAEDVTQKAFINAYQHLDQFRGDSFRSWLFRILRNLAYDEFRRPSYRRVTSLEALEDDRGWQGVQDPSVEPEEALENRELAIRIERAVQQVPEPYRTVLVLVDIQQMDYQEAAQAAGVPVGTVKSRLARARQHMRGALAE